MYEWVRAAFSHRINLNSTYKSNSIGEKSRKLLLRRLIAVPSLACIRETEICCSDLVGHLTMIHYGDPNKWSFFSMLPTDGGCQDPRTYEIFTKSMSTINIWSIYFHYMCYYYYYYIPYMAYYSLLVCWFYQWVYKISCQSTNPYRAYQILYQLTTKSLQNNLPIPYKVPTKLTTELLHYYWPIIYQNFYKITYQLSIRPLPDNLPCHLLDIYKTATKLSTAFMVAIEGRLRMVSYRCCHNIFITYYSH